MRTPLASRLAAGLGFVRYASLLGVVSTAAGAVLMFVNGAWKTWKCLVGFATGKPIGDPGLDPSAALTTELFSALDSFLFAIVMLYVSTGIFTLFVSDDPEAVSRRLPRPLVPRSLAEMKHQVAVVVVVLLFVLFLELAWSSVKTLHGKTWELMILPASILLMAAALRLLTASRNE